MNDIHAAISARNRGEATVADLAVIHAHRIEVARERLADAVAHEAETRRWHGAAGFSAQQRADARLDTDEARTALAALVARG